MVNGSAPTPDPSAQQSKKQMLPMPEVEILYRDVMTPDGAPVRVIAGLRLSGQDVGGVMGAAVTADATKGSTVLLLDLKTTWPVRWVDVNEPQLQVATQLPPEPPRGPRRL